MKVKHDCKKELKEVSLKVTPARLAVLSLLERTQTPLDVTSILNVLRKRHIDIDPSTIFRIVNTFTNKGITRQMQFNDGKSRYEVQREEHHHLICKVCGTIEDISDCNIDALEKDITRKKGFLVQQHSLEFFGVCKQCLR